MAQEHFYQVDLKWRNGRVGEVSSPDLSTTIECATPPEFEGGVPNVWSPEHFYAAAINSCFMTTFLAIAEKSKVAFESFEAKTVIKLEILEKGFVISEAVITPQVKLVDYDKDNERVLKVFEKTKKHCLVTNSMKTEVTVEPVVA